MADVGLDSSIQRFAAGRTGLSIFSRGETEALRAVADTFIAPLIEEDGTSDFWKGRGSDLCIEQEILTRMGEMPRAMQRDFTLLIKILASPLPGLMLLKRPKPFGHLSLRDREGLLLRWSKSRLSPLRRAFQSLKRICCFIYYASLRARAPAMAQSLGYPAPPLAPPGHERLRPQMPMCDNEIIDCDVLVIGSGAGGGTIAGTLAEAGLDVLVVEKGAFMPKANRTDLEYDMISELYESGGLQTSADQAISIFAGNCIGGGTVINWSVCLPPDEILLNEWATDHDFPDLLGATFRRCIDDVQKALKVKDEVPHNETNKALLAGADGRSRPLPQNVDGCHDQNERNCGYCLFGCRAGYKQDVTEVFLGRDSVEVPPRIVERTRVVRLVQQAGRISHAIGETRRADGTTMTVTLRAKQFVVAAGAVRTPQLLLASGIGHPELGRHLYLHPAELVIGEYAYAINSWHGGMMTSMCEAAPRGDRAGFDCKIETSPLHLGLLSAALPWLGAAEHKRLMMRAPHYAGFAAITRDRHGGTVSIDRHGEVNIAYEFHPEDRARSHIGKAMAAAVHLRAGAERVFTSHNSGLIFDTSTIGISEDTIHKRITALPWSANNAMVFSSHQMGTCRMGGNSRKSPVRPNGQFVSVPNLYIADGSLFPSASGINPMITIEALARYVGLGIAASLKGL